MFYNKDNRPPENPERRSGMNSGRKQRQKDKDKGIYPRSDLPVNKTKGAIWIKAYQSAYYQPNSPGKPLDGDSPKISITVRVDRNIHQQAVDLNINISKACENGIKMAGELSKHTNN